jgi:purine catabolism regulator
VPDIAAWARPQALLLTTGYPLRADPDRLPGLVADLDERGVSALVVKLHRYLETLPAPMLAEADRRGLPLVLVPDDLGFDAVLTQVFTSLVDERVPLLERSEQMHRHLVDVVLSGGGLADVVAAVSRLFGGVAMITSTDGRVKAEAGDAGWRAALRDSPLFHRSGRFRTEVSGPGVHALDAVPGSHAVVSVAGQGIEHGRLVLLHPERALNDVDLAVLERAAAVAAICLSTEVAVTAVESKYRGDFLRDVLAGRAGDEQEVRVHAATLGWDLDRPAVVVVAALETRDAPPMSRGYRGPLEVERFAAAWTTVVGAQDPAAPVVGFAAEVVALLPVDGGDPRAAVARAVQAVRGDGGGGRRPFAAGVSRVAGSAAALPGAYEQARRALAVGQRQHRPGAVVHFDDLGVFRLLSLIEDEGELAAFAEQTLGELARETAEAAAMRRTLRVLLDTNLNVAEAARALHFHYNTLRYRIAKLERVVGPFTSDATLRLDLALALRIVAMRAL